MRDDHLENHRNRQEVLCKRIQQVRLARGYTIRDLSIKTGIAEASLSGYEHGKKGIGLSTLLKLADVLNCSLDYLVGRGQFLERSSPIPVNDCQDRRDPNPSDDCGYPQTEERRETGEAGEDAKSRFMEEMSGLFDITATQKTILKAFGLTDANVKYRAEEISKRLEAGM